MKKVSAQLLGQLYAPQSKTSSQTSDESLEKRRAARVWTRLIEMYGDRFSREYGGEPNETWTMAIARMSDAQIVRSLTTLAERGGPHPPTLPEFVTASSPATGSPRYLGVPTTLQAVKALTQDRRIVDREKYERELAELRRLCR